LSDNSQFFPILQYYPTGINARYYLCNFGRLATWSVLGTLAMAKAPMDLRSTKRMAHYINATDFESFEYCEVNPIGDGIFGYSGSRRDN
jgi:hypothetical protein